MRATEQAGSPCGRHRSLDIHRCRRQVDTGTLVTGLEAVHQRATLQGDLATGGVDARVCLDEPGHHGQRERDAVSGPPATPQTHIAAGPDRSRDIVADGHGGAAGPGGDAQGQCPGPRRSLEQRERDAALPGQLAAHLEPDAAPGQARFEHAIEVLVDLDAGIIGRRGVVADTGHEAHHVGRTAGHVVPLGATVRTVAQQRIAVEEGAPVAETAGSTPL